MPKTETNAQTVEIKDTTDGEVNRFLREIIITSVPKESTSKGIVIILKQPRYVDFKIEETINVLLNHLKGKYSHFYFINTTSVLDPDNVGSAGTNFANIANLKKSFDLVKRSLSPSSSDLLLAFGRDIFNNAIPKRYQAQNFAALKAFVDLDIWIEKYYTSDINAKFIYPGRKYKNKLIQAPLKALESIIKK